MCSNICSSSRTYTFLVKFSVSHGPLYSVARATPDEYVNFLNRGTPETAEELTHGGLLCAFLVGELPDNPPFGGLFANSNSVASPRKGEALGFCFVNDIVLSFLELLHTHQRVLYVDIDIHRGDAFYTTDGVLCASFHKLGEFFPGTGTQDDCGRGKGKGYSLNVPLDDGITESTQVMDRVIDVFQLTVIVLQCGADPLSGDKLGRFNLSLSGQAPANRPHLGIRDDLGLENDVSEELPWCEYFEWFGPRYRFEVAQGNMEDLTLRDGGLDCLRERALEQLQELYLHLALCMEMQDVPEETLRRIWAPASRLNAWLAMNELDETLARETYKSDAYTLLREVERNGNGSGDSEESGNEEEDNSDRGYSSDDAESGANGKRRKRMSIVTTQYIDVGPTMSMGAGRGMCVRRRAAWSALRRLSLQGKRERELERELEREEEEEDMDVDVDVDEDGERGRG
ncbi:hypothetical protein C8F01DRAFT_1376027 [Mycena amicta]|nr:hypothetical protein C8F01DRAFT_1376027 [Mycena amicta]